MQQKLIDLSTQYVQAGSAILDAIRDIIKDAGGFINASNNKLEKSDMKALVFDSKTGYSETFPIRRLLKGSNILFYQTILSITRNIDEYLGSASLSH